MKKLYLITIIFFNSKSSPIALNIQSDFDIYMQNSVFYNPKLSINNQEWQILKNQFNNLSKFKSKFGLIPRKIHQIWLGSPFPEKYKKLQQSWIKNHPNWEYKLWTEKDIQDFKLQNIELYNSTKNYGEKSDIARYEILYRIGGIYVDCDFECLKSLEELIYFCDFFAGVGYGPNPIILSGIIGATPKHPILKSCMEIKKLNNIENYYEILNRTSIFHFTRCFFKSFTAHSIIFPVTFFYPLPDFNRNQTEVLNYIKPESYAVHYWHISWNKGKMS